MWDHNAAENGGMRLASDGFNPISSKRQARKQGMSTLRLLLIAIVILGVSIACLLLCGTHVISRFYMAHWRCAGHLLGLITTAQCLDGGLHGRCMAAPISCKPDCTTCVEQPVVSKFLHLAPAQFAAVLLVSQLARHKPGYDPEVSAGMMNLLCVGTAAP